MPTQKKHTLLTVYLGLVSLIAFIWLAISVIVFTHKVISTNIITDDEYIAQNHREMDRCEEPIYLWDNKSETKTEAEKEECIKKSKENLILQRNVDKKEVMILSWLRGIILLVIFPLHFIYFKKYNK